jgi:hypothetical protein
VKQTVKTRLRPRQSLVLGVLAAWAVVLTGCSSNLNNFGDPASTGGASTTSLARGEAPGTPPPAFPLVHDIPPPRTNAVLNEYEQKKLEIDLIAARRRVAPEADKPAAKKPAAPQNTGKKQDP